MDRIQEIAEADLGNDAARCVGCRNRVGLQAALVLEKDVVCCRRCWNRRDALPILRDYVLALAVVA
jgi:hypothetical protein